MKCLSSNLKKVSKVCKKKTPLKVSVWILWKFKRNGEKWLCFCSFFHRFFNCDHQFFIAILHRDLRNCFFFRHLLFTFHIVFGLLFPLFYLDFCFPFLFGLLFPFSIWTFISLLHLNFFSILFQFFSISLQFLFFIRLRSHFGFLPIFFLSRKR